MMSLIPVVKIGDGPVALLCQGSKGPVHIVDMFCMGIFFVIHCGRIPPLVQELFQHKCLVAEDIVSGGSDNHHRGQFGLFGDVAFRIDRCMTDGIVLVIASIDHPQQTRFGNFVGHPLLSWEIGCLIDPAHRMGQGRAVN